MKAITGAKSILFYKTLKIIHGRISVSPGHIDDALYSQIKCKISMKYHQTLTKFIWDWHMKIRISQQFILFQRTLKMIFVKSSVSPGHVHIAIYSIIEYGIRLKNPQILTACPLDWQGKTIMGYWITLFHETLKIIFVRYSVSPGHIHIAMYRRKKCKISQKIPSNCIFHSLRPTYKIWTYQ